MTVFYFTATGNSLAIAKRIGGNLVSISQVVDLPKQHYEDDVIGVVFPIYSLAPPFMVSRFLENATLKAEYLFAVGTYGNSPGAAMPNLQRQMAERGVMFDYAASILMLDNYLPVFDVDAQIAKLPKKNIEESTARIVSDIHSRTKSEAKASMIAKAVTGLLRKTANPSKASKLAQGYIVNDDCTNCGTCAKVCPTANVTVTDKVHFGERCENCFACVHLCPQNALHLKNERSGKRWRNADVSLSEIVAANQRV
jgi:ferredoxin